MDELLLFDRQFRDRGTSSVAMVNWAIRTGGGDPGGYDGPRPSDRSDLARCSEAVAVAPRWLAERCAELLGAFTTEVTGQAPGVDGPAPSTVLVVDDHHDGFTYVADPGVSVVELGEDAYVNATSVTIGAELVDDLRRVAALPSALRVAAFERIVVWLDRRSGRMARASRTGDASLSADDRAAVDAAVLEWLRTTSPDVAADWVTASQHR